MLARAKVNLYLHVVGKRADGYHLLDSLIVFAETGDDIRVAPAETLTLTIDGPFGRGLDTGTGNLVMRAALALRELTGSKRGAAIHLTKNLPLASGIGGGSADAAATLLALIDLWQVTPERAALYQLAERLGADVPVCLDGRPAFVGGVGEDIVPAGTLPRMHILLVNPLVETPTPAVFKARRGDFSNPARWARPPATPQDLAAYLLGRRNDLTDPAITVAPAVAAVLDAIAATPDCLLARLSGSGATCFGLYADAARAAQARAAVLAGHPDWWAQEAPIS
ncbi:4-(cytidine 5'-diphospho)-2-C-methyl-D-erythritol kinase [Dongia rigui]|uniref:4-diphosphocytidyl-2-C-methyl-D-erythritol kinase n=1 Tax=Dongia rigui TaxID=940149 RepID=A0ABU5DVH7_9PROT|nr:4-(cytidine 5'-diphospho)-2-C-methyl-D-erythritol kinase [Dongia rigui]MDY0871305.1 4-(cytidine 5'-diphospho)-2-C-methyl-D-erythritol kinase [Dongia rigui]